jgi:omega-6 fatty acid desaturase (delta-12 desaturase)
VVSSPVLELRQPLVALRAQPAGWAAFLSFAAATAYLACFLGAAFLGSIWLRVACSLALGPLIALLFRIAHDAGHDCHFNSRRLNRVVGQLSNLPSYHPFSLWLLFHNRCHHAFTNLKGRDYIWVPLSKEEYDRLTWAGRGMERFYRTTIGVGAYYLYAIWWSKMLFPRRHFVQKRKLRYFLDSVAVMGFFCLQLAVLSIGAQDLDQFAARVLLSIMLPFLAFNWMVGFVSFLNHTHPTVPWFSRRDEWSFYTGQVTCTVHMGVPSWLIFFVTDLGLHGAHHIDPRIPIWGLDRAESRILADARTNIVMENWTWRRYREILQHCKLYDYDGRRWLDFDGRPIETAATST